MTAAAVEARPVREGPILFSSAMIRALLAGRKTQTRRLYKPRVPAPYEIIDEREDGSLWPFFSDEYGDYHEVPCPYGDLGDRLWVRETWAVRLDQDHVKPRDLDPKRDAPFFWADPQTCNTGCAGAAGKRRPGIFLPRWASRLTLGVTAVRVQRLQDISEEDARAEGFDSQPMPAMINGVRGTVAIFDPVKWFQTLWDQINGKRAPWSLNPWVFALTFRRLP